MYIGTRVAKQDYLVTIGIAPSHPSTGFGYVRLGEKLGLPHAPNARLVASFKEKPDARTAANYIATGSYRWNAGMFVVKASVLIEQLHKYKPDLADGLMKIASAWDDVWAGPAPGDTGAYIKWRVEGTEGLAEGTIGWPGYPNRQPSTIRFSSNRHPGVWHEPSWTEVWFPDAFSGPMAELMDAITEQRIPSNSGTDNLETMAVLEACYRSLHEHRPIFVRDCR